MFNSKIYTSKLLFNYANQNYKIPSFCFIITDILAQKSTTKLIVVCTDFRKLLHRLQLQVACKIMASSGGRSNSRRNRHQRKDSLSVDNVNAEYQARNVRYSHSPTPGNSASKHHRRNSISKAKEAKKNFNLETFVQQQQNLNMKFTDDSMNNPINNNNNINIPLKQYKITAEEHKPPTIETNSYSSTKSVPKPQKPQKQRSIPIPTYTKPAASPIPINPHPNDYNDNHNNDNISIPIKNIPASSPQPIPLKNYDSNSSSIIISIGDDRPKSNKYTSRRGHGRHGSSGTHSRHGSGSYHHRHHRSQHSGSNIAIPLSIRPDASPIPQPSKSKYQRAGKSINISISGAKNNNRSSPPKSYQKHRSKPSPHSINIPAAMIPQTSPQPIPSTSNDKRQFTTIQIGNNITKQPQMLRSKQTSSL